MTIILKWWTGTASYAKGLRTKERDTDSLPVVVIIIKSYFIVDNNPLNNNKFTCVRE